MCGITGYIDLDRALPVVRIREMTERLSHRGPDAQDTFLEEPVAMGHSRLKIIDLSEQSAQPMLSHDRRYVIVFNGEVYNFKEIAQELGGKFRSAGDTEVVLEAYARWGSEFVHRLNGMFAMAIYDRLDGRVDLFRDRLGIKPLYYFHGKNLFAFASELKALTACPEIKSALTLDRAAISNFLHIGCIPAPQSIYQEVRKLPPGCHVSYQIDGGKLADVHCYWDPRNQFTQQVHSNEGEALDELRELVTDAVSKRMLSDVPLGCFLSGGIDSSLVSAIAHKMSDKPLQTFSIGFRESQYNESDYAEAVANHLGTSHHTFMLGQGDALPLVDRLTDIYDEPFGDSSAIPTLLVSARAREHVTVALSGDGGDETHLGYGAYTWAQRLAMPGMQSLRKPIAAGLALLGSRYQRGGMLFRYEDAEGIMSHICSQEQNCFMRHEIPSYLLEAYQSPAGLDLSQSGVRRTLQPAESQALFDLRYYLPDDLLVKVDRASMHNSLEVRVPLLDHELVTFALNLDHRLKRRGRDFKYLLKQLLFEYVPSQYFNRPKWGFSIPLRDWLTQDLKPIVDEELHPAAVEEAGICDPFAVSNLVNQFRQGKDYLYKRIWLLILLHRWMRKHT